MSKISPFMTKKEAAEYLRVTPRVVDRLAREGLLTRYHVGRSPRFDVKEVHGVVVMDEEVGSRPSPNPKAKQTA